MRGRPRAPRRRLNPAFVSALRRNGRTLEALARSANFPSSQWLSEHTQEACETAATPLMVRRLHVLAYLIEFPREQIFEAEQ